MASYLWVERVVNDVFGPYDTWAEFNKYAPSAFRGDVNQKRAESARRKLEPQAQRLDMGYVVDIEPLDG